jgi:hypothetical protein
VRKTAKADPKVAPTIIPPSRRFVQKTYPLGKDQYFRWDKALPASDAVEDEEIVRKLLLPENEA